jgi:hypothetical protein
MQKKIVARQLRTQQNHSPEDTYTDTAIALVTPSRAYSCHGVCKTTFCTGQKKMMIPKYAHMLKRSSANRAFISKTDIPKTEFSRVANIKKDNKIFRMCHSMQAFPSSQKKKLATYLERIKSEIHMTQLHTEGHMLIVCADLHTHQRVHRIIIWSNHQLTSVKQAPAKHIKT